MGITEKLNVTPIINASGKMTILGVSTVNDAVIEAQRVGGQTFYLMEELVNKSGEVISEMIGSEASVVVSSASAGIAQSVAALIGRGDPYHTMHPYDTRFTQREIIIPKGHNVDYGTSVELMIQQGGGVVVEAGYANECTLDQIAMEVTEKTAAILIVKSHHTVQKSMPSVEEVIQLGRSLNVPVIVDAAAEEDVRKYAILNPDLLIFSGAKAIEGPSSGLVIGKKEYVDWVKLQSKGLGRSMKIGKDNILGFVAALDWYLNHGSEDGTSMKLRLEPFVAHLNNVDGIDASIKQDSAGRDIYRASVVVQSDKRTARDLVEAMKTLSPAIYTREYNVNNGIIEFDIRSVTESQLKYCAIQIQRLMEEMS